MVLQQNQKSSICFNNVLIIRLLASSRFCNDCFQKSVVYSTLLVEFLRRSIMKIFMVVLFFSIPNFCRME